MILCIYHAIHLFFWTKKSPIRERSPVRPEEKRSCHATPRWFPSGTDRRLKTVKFGKHFQGKHSKIVKFQKDMLSIAMIDARSEKRRPAWIPRAHPWEPEPPCFRSHRTAASAAASAAASRWGQPEPSSGARQASSPPSPTSFASIDKCFRRAIQATTSRRF